MTPCFAAAFVRFSSPSGWPSFPNAVAVCAPHLSIRYGWRGQRDAYEIDRHRSRVPQDMCREVHCGNITQHPRTEPDSGRGIVEQRGLSIDSALPVICSMVFSVRDFIVCSGRVISPGFLRHYLSGNGLSPHGYDEPYVDWPNEWQNPPRSRADSGSRKAVVGLPPSSALLPLHP